MSSSNHQVVTNKINVIIWKPIIYKSIRNKGAVFKGAGRSLVTIVSESPHDATNLKKLGKSIFRLYVWACFVQHSHFSIFAGSRETATLQLKDGTNVILEQPFV